jgi:hypothetical protein
VAVLSRAAALAVVVLALALGAAPARAQLASPGDLAKAHANLDGMSSCGKCHPAGKQLSGALCLDCHTELKRRVEQHRGFHGKMGETERSSCQTCHHEHEGRDYKLIEWKPSKDHFDHNRTGWPLRGKHAQQRCGTCHDPKKLVEADALALLKKKVGGSETYLGLGQKCTTCHFDEHRGQVSDTCENCHTEMGWKPPPKFDHNKTKYPLTGGHKKVACKDCHANVKDDESHPAFPPPRASSYMKLNGIDHNQCSDCHEDPHQGRFGRRCDGCHVTEGWKVIKKSAEERAFHDKTRYPLKGMHQTVPCVSCHGPFAGKPAKFKNMTFGACTDCHRDAHQGQLAQAKCDRCHSVEGFRPASFEVEEHAKTSYPLGGAHAAVACEACHPHDAKLAASSPAPGKKPPPPPAHGKPTGPQDLTPVSTVVLRLPGKAERCESCHTDPHGGQFNAVKGGCAHCHEVASFSKIHFDHDKESRFPLLGKHRETVCGSCHKAARTAQGKRAEIVRYKPLDTACASCHADAHVGQFQPPACEKCHETTKFTQTTFQHNDKRFTTFALDGKHAKVGCDKCHTLVAVATTSGPVKVRRYKPVPRECEACHSDFHHGDFKGFDQ